MNYAITVLIEERIKLTNRIKAHENFIENYSGYLDNKNIKPYIDDLNDLTDKLADVIQAIEKL